MAGALFVNAARESVLSFSRPYVRNGLVIVTRQDPAAPADADHLDGRTIAMVRNSAAIPLLQQRYPQAKVVTADNPTEAMLLVADGQADAVVQTQISASYYVNRYFAGKLRIASALDLPPAEIRAGDGARPDRADIHPEQGALQHFERRTPPPSSAAGAAATAIRAPGTPTATKSTC